MCLKTLAFCSYPCHVFFSLSLSFSFLAHHYKSCLLSIGKKFLFSTITTLLTWCWLSLTACIISVDILVILLACGSVHNIPPSYGSAATHGCTQMQVYVTNHSHSRFPGPGPPHYMLSLGQVQLMTSVIHPLFCLHAFVAGLSPFVHSCLLFFFLTSFFLVIWCLQWHHAVVHHV